jgi:branched-chain amino acid transport system ATP-binding protein
MKLSVQDLTKQIGGVVAVDHLSFDIDDRAVLGLVGPNGSGKTITLQMIAGLIKPSGGRVILDGERIDGHSAHAVASRGVAYIHQIPRVFGNITVLDNLLFAAAPKVLSSNILSLLKNELLPNNKIVDMDGLLRSTGLERLRNSPAKTLSYGQQKLLLISMLLVRDPKPTMILLDEPMAGVNPKMAISLIDLIKRACATGATLIIVEHKMRVIMQLCQSVIVLEKGQKLAEGTPQEISNDTDVIKAFLGEEVLL